jgi:hypothetical protein
MNDDLERIWKEAIMAKLGYSRGIWMEKMRKIMQNLNQNNQLAQLTNKKLEF